MEIFKVYNPQEESNAKWELTEKLKSQVSNGEMTLREASRAAEKHHYTKIKHLVTLKPGVAIGLNPFWRNPEDAPPLPDAHFDAHTRGHW